MNENKISAEMRHDIRYHVQQCFIPEMVECVKDGYLPFIALFPSAQWLSNLRMDYELEDLKAAKVWDSFEKIQVDEDTMIVLYTFPEPEDVPEAIYGVVLLNQATNELKYFTLEASYEDKWAVCSRDTSIHSCHGFWSSPDKSRFVEWVKDRTFV